MLAKTLGRIDNILHFWFGDRVEVTDVYLKGRMQFWFGKNPVVDKEIKDRFELQDYKLSVEGKTVPWRETPRGCLAQILVFDQFPRNMFRGDHLMYATDAQALETAKHAVAQGYDKSLSPVERMFLYMPFQHSENIEDQTIGVRLFEELARESTLLTDDLKYAKMHYDVIKRFGRFPHRNEILSRRSTPEEVEFLGQPGSRF